jgi:hypothetical protein
MTNNVDLNIYVMDYLYDPRHKAMQSIRALVLEHAESRDNIGAHTCQRISMVWVANQCQPPCHARPLTCNYLWIW